MADLSNVDLPSGRDPGAVLAAVRRRGAALRRRRQASLGGAALALVVAVAVPFARAAEPEQRVEVTDASTTTSTTEAPVPTTTTSAPVTTTVPPAPRPAAPPPTTTSTTAPPVRWCTKEALAVKVATDKRTYRVGETVKLTATVRNASAASCYLPLDRFIDHLDAEGRALASVGVTSDYGSEGPEPFAPGTTQQWDEKWNQAGCRDSAPCSQVDPGTYTIEMGWHTYEWKASGRATVEVMAGQ